MNERPTDAAPTASTENGAGAAVAIARRALKIARVLLLREAEAKGNTAIYRAVMMAAWNLDTQALLLTPKTATGRFFGRGNENTPTDRA